MKLGFSLRFPLRSLRLCVEAVFLLILSASGAQHPQPARFPTPHEQAVSKDGARHLARFEGTEEVV